MFRVIHSRFNTLLRALFLSQKSALLDGDGVRNHHIVSQTFVPGIYLIPDIVLVVSCHDSRYAIYWIFEYRILNGVLS